MVIVMVMAMTTMMEKMKMNLDEDGDDDVHQLSMRQGTNSTAMMIETGVDDDYEAVRCSN